MYSYPVIPPNLPKEGSVPRRSAEHRAPPCIWFSPESSPWRFIERKGIGGGMEVLLWELGASSFYLGSCGKCGKGRGSISRREHSSSVEREREMRLIRP